jgi:DNA-directed RNA polymerase subunit H
MEKEIDVLQHELVPEHKILNEEEKKKLFSQYGIKEKNLPRISVKDPAIKSIGAKINDVIEITRDSETAGITKYYRVVVPKK